MNCCKNVLLAAVLCLPIGSVINAGPKALKDTAKAYGAMYGAYFLSGTVFATKVGRVKQKEWIEKARKYNVPALEHIATRWGRGNPILETNRLVFQHIARTPRWTLPPFIWASVAFHAYKNKDLNNLNF